VILILKIHKSLSESSFIHSILHRFNTLSKKTASLISHPRIIED